MSGQDDARKTIDQNIIFITTDRVTLVARSLTSVSAVTLVTIPVLILYSLDSLVLRFGVAALCACCFALFISSLSQVRLIEIFAATSA